MNRASSATTRARTAPGGRGDRAGRMLAPADVVTSPVTRSSYRIDRFLGEGGFGQVYFARRMGASQAGGITPNCRQNELVTVPLVFVR